MDKLKNDDRFKDALTNPKYFKANKKDTKVKLGKRFGHILTDKDFTLKYSVDSKGRPLKQSANEDLKKYYQCSDSEDEIENEKIKNKDTKSQEKQEKEEALDVSESDDDDESGDDDDEEESSSSSSDDDDDSSSEADANSEQIVHTWGEMDHDTTTTDQATPRLAICNMDWDRIKAVDLFILFHSFKPSDGKIISVSIYPSEFGLERMKQEDTYGPQELKADKKEDEKHYNERMRRYQLNRLKYYYAVLLCDTCNTADSIYNNCNNIEYEASATVMDLRFVPADMTFEHSATDTATSLPPPDHYKPSPFVNSALHQCKVNLTWDETPLERTKVLNQDLKKVSEDDELFNQYIASASEDDDSDGGGDGDGGSSDDDDDGGENSNDNEDIDSDDGGFVEKSESDNDEIDNEIDNDNAESDVVDGEIDNDNAESDVGDEKDMKIDEKESDDEEDKDGDNEGDDDDADEVSDIKDTKLNSLKNENKEANTESANNQNPNLNDFNSEEDNNINNNNSIKENKKNKKRKRDRSEEGFEDQIQKYRDLLKEVTEKEDMDDGADDDDDVDMEVTWKTGTMEAAEGMLMEKKKSEMTSFEKYHEKRKMKRKLKKLTKLHSKNEVTPDESPKRKFKSVPEMSQSDKADLELLMMDKANMHSFKKDSMEDSMEDSMGGKKMSKRQKMKKKIMAKKMMKQDESLPTKVTDTRFSKMYTDEDFFLQQSEQRT